MVAEQQVHQALREVKHPESGSSLMELDMIREIKVEDRQVRFTIILPFMNVPIKDQIVSEARAAVEKLPGVKGVDVELAEMTQKERARFMAAQEKRVGLAEQFNRIEHVIAVMSGKGGVGKSLVAALLAIALRSEGHKVGVLDADITGPSIPKMFFPMQKHPNNSPMGIVPVETEMGIKVMSINLLLPSEDQAVIWRGPLISTAIKQFWGDVFWGDLDYLIVDLPPGTADASLTVMQSIPLSGVVLVTSPQGLAGMVVRKAAQMARHLQVVPILGLVENMSYFICPDNGKRYLIFGLSHAEEMARRLGVPFLGQLPIDPHIAELCDAGRIEDYPAEEFAAIASRLAETATQARCPSFMSMGDRQ